MHFLSVTRRSLWRTFTSRASFLGVAGAVPALPPRKKRRLLHLVGQPSGRAMRVLCLLCSNEKHTNHHDPTRYCSTKRTYEVFVALFTCCCCLHTHARTQSTHTKILGVTRCFGSPLKKKRVRKHGVKTTKHSIALPPSMYLLVSTGEYMRAPLRFRGAVKIVLVPQSIQWTESNTGNVYRNMSGNQPLLSSP